MALQILGHRAFLGAPKGADVRMPASFVQPDLTHFAHKQALEKGAGVHLSVVCPVPSFLVPHPVFPGLLLQPTRVGSAFTLPLSIVSTQLLPSHSMGKFHLPL